MSQGVAVWTCLPKTACLRLEVESGEPKSIVAIDAPKKFGSDLIMMGATGLNAFQRAMIGSVADYAIRAADCDVLLVRTDDKNQPYQKEEKGE